MPRPTFVGTALDVTRTGSNANPETHSMTVDASANAVVGVVHAGLGFADTALSATLDGNAMQVAMSIDRSNSQVAYIFYIDSADGNWPGTGVMDISFAGVTGADLKIWAQGLQDVDTSIGFSDMQEMGLTGQTDPTLTLANGDTSLDMILVAATSFSGNNPTPAGTELDRYDGATGAASGLVWQLDCTSATQVVEFDTGGVSKTVAWGLVTITGTGVSDSVAPNLSSATSASITNVSVTLGATTDEDNGIAHVIVVPDGEASTPTNQQIIDASYGNIEGTPPADLTLSATGAFTFASYTGLTGGVIYDYAIVHEDAAGNEDAGSRVEGTFTTQSATASFDTDLNSGTVDGYLMDGATSGNPDKLVDIVAGTTNGTGILSVDLNAVAVTNSQVVEGLVEDQATGDPIPLQGTVSIS